MLQHGRGGVLAWGCKLTSELVLFQETVHTVFTTRNSEIFEGSHFAQTSSAQQLCSKKHECSYCHKTFGNKTNLVHHVRIHTGERPFKCKVLRIDADKTLRLSVALSVYRIVPVWGSKVSVGVGKRETSTCYKMLSVSKCQRKSHQLEEKIESTTISKNQFSCSVCSKVFPFKTISAHNGIIRKGDHQIVYDADKCSSQGFEMTNLERKKYQCNFCVKSFRFKSKFEEHTRVHTGERPFKCDICLKHFKSKQSLKYHGKQSHKIET
ncbi:UNVERIFIED_CONTAM: zinc finger protein [Trichonephila clavipes]